MKKFQIKILLSVIFFTLDLFAQQYAEGSAEWLVDMFFNRGNFNEKSKYYTGEMINDAQQPTIGEELKNSDAQILFYKISETEERQTFAIELVLNKQVIDFYCYIKNENGTWKIEAVRRFLLPGFIYSVYDSLSNLTSPSAADQNLLKTLQIFTMNDAGLKNYLSDNVNSFNNVVYFFNQNKNKEVDSRLSLLYCNAVYKDSRFPNCVFIQINSFERMEAGFIYATKNSVIPEMSPDGYVFIEMVLPDWYIYRIM